MQSLRDAADGAARLLMRAGAAVGLLVAVATAVVAVDAAALDAGRSRQGRDGAPAPRLEHRIDPAAATVDRLPSSHRAGFLRRHSAWRPRLHRTTAPWIDAATSRHLRVPVDAIVDPFAERWQLDAVPAAAEPQVATVPCRRLRLAAAQDAPVRGPYLVRSFPRPPPART